MSWKILVADDISAEGIAILSAADCLLVRAPNAPAAVAGAPCRIIRLA